MRRSDVYFTSTAVGVLGLCLMFVHSARLQERDLEVVDSKRGMVRALQLTDMCLFTEASYTRHLSQADLHTPFQDHPGAFEHFPSGTLLPAPRAAGKVP